MADNTMRPPPPPRQITATMTLADCIFWIAFGQLPMPTILEELYRYREARHPMYDKNSHDSGAIMEARMILVHHLNRGDITAAGHFLPLEEGPIVFETSFTLPKGGLGSLKSSEAKPIPKEAWHVSITDRDMDHSSLCHPSHLGNGREVAYNTIQFATSDVLRLSPKEDMDSILAEYENGNEYLPKASPIKEVPKQKITPKGSNNNAGRKEEYKWHEFFAASEEIIKKRDIPYDLKSQLESRMRIWCRKNWGKTPSPSSIRSKLTKQLTDFKESGQYLNTLQNIG